MKCTIFLFISLTVLSNIGASRKYNELDEDFMDLDTFVRRGKKSPDYGGGGPLAKGQGPDYGGGGPLAKQGEPGQHRNAPVTAPNTTPAPLTAVPGKGLPPSSSLQVDQCKALIKALTEEQSILQKKSKRILKIIHDGHDRPPMYIALGATACSNQDQCKLACISEGCNYFQSFHDRSKSSISFLYIVNETILSNSNNFIESELMDSYVVKYRSSKTKNSNSRRPRRKRQTVYPCSPCVIPFGFGGRPGVATCNAVCSNGQVGTVQSSSLGVNVHEEHNEEHHATHINHGHHKSFQSFKVEYHKSYESPSVQAQAQANYEQNVQTMDESNSHSEKHDDAKQGVTEFADENMASFEMMHTGAMTDGPIQPMPFQPPLPQIPIPPLPALHWEKAVNTALPPVRYQGRCGSCYAFSSSDMLATQYVIERRGAMEDMKSETLSVQYLMDCGGKNASVGCKGGRPAVLMKNLENSDGIPLESCYRYKEDTGNQCRVQNAVKCCRRHKVKFSQLIDIHGPHEKEIWAALLNWGPVVSIVGVNEQWMFYNGTGVIKARQCNSNNHNHAVVIVGYNYNKTETDTPHLIVRNSWGPRWGTKGYAKLETGKNTCGVANFVLVSCTADCRNIKTVMDLIKRNNVPQEYITKYGDIKMFNNPHEKGPGGNGDRKSG